MLVEYEGVPHAILRELNDFGYESYDLARLPRRLGSGARDDHGIEQNIDRRRTRILRTPAELMTGLPEADSWLGMTGRTLGRLYTAFLLAEDPQRRLDVRKAATLMHQMSLVQHILTQPHLRKVLIGDEVGLGKTIEAGLLIRELIDRDPTIKILYLAPARLVSNVAHELREKLDLDARKWVAGSASDARLESDSLVVASIHKAVFGRNLEAMAKSGPWDVLIVDECHHLSDWGPGGGSPNRMFRLVNQLVKAQQRDSRLILMSGTPHQGSETRFTNLLRLLSDDGKTHETAAGRVIFRTKDRVRDWLNNPLFPSREIRSPTLVDLGERYKCWYGRIFELYSRPSKEGAQSRAAGWAKSQALQWAASSVQAGLGFLARLAIRRLRWDLREASLSGAIAVLRPYRGGARQEPLEDLYGRLSRQIGLQVDTANSVEDAEELDQEEPWMPDAQLLAALLDEGVELLRAGAADQKWEALCKIIDASDGEKVVLFAQPVETVGVVAAFLEERYSEKPAVIIGNQSDEDRIKEVSAFQSAAGPRFLVSSRAGGEGLNLQVARRLVHLDVPWNPMDMEQRVGRVHRFGSRKTILVDTVVAAGSREIDMYRVAREKLTLIASQLDPEAFEQLFSRVMSLVPPKELEDIIGAAPSGPMGAVISDKIGQLVRVGFESWKAFDESYRNEAERIRDIEPGQATWGDLADFLRRLGGAELAPNVSVATFAFRNEEVESVSREIPALLMDGQTYVCGDTAGSPIDAPTGTPVLVLGLNVDAVKSRLRNNFLPIKECGAALVRRPQELDGILPPLTDSLMVFLCQTFQFTANNRSEVALTLRVFALTRDGGEVELDPKPRGDVVRCLVRAQRVQRPQSEKGWMGIEDIERRLMVRLRTLSEEDREERRLNAIWPIALIGLV